MNTAWISNTSADILLAETDRTFPLETGGVLMGYVTGKELVISEIIGPGPDAIHRTHSFTPDYAYQEIEVARIYEASCRKWTYLGDWHSHPRQKWPNLSAKDIQTLHRIGRSKKARIAAPLMLISSGQPTAWKLNIWQWQPGKLFRSRSRAVPLSVKIY
jgi:integrative and conjugative element protein (TIGR02256 family)